jgi:NAD(P)-dependent dehydrogenase (short-subunit alcohol dehydrogenase family)
MEDVDGTIKQIEDGDQVLIDYRNRHDQQLGKAKEFRERAAEHLAQADAYMLDISDARAKLRHLETLQRTQKTYAASFKYKETACDRVAREIVGRVTTRREMLLRKEIDRRVNAIGKKIVRNVGHRRSGGGFDMIEDDGMLPGGRKNPASLTNKLAQENGTQE